MDYLNCMLCPRKCGANRSVGQIGFCGAPDEAVVAKTMAHFWEEPVISGEKGSGAVFFSGCTLRCTYCQNCEISTQIRGERVTSARLRQMFETLMEAGCHNINLVTATQYLPTVIPALKPKLPVPVVYNCGGYESVQTLQQLEGLVDIYLPDLKYSDPGLARSLSAAADYVQTAHDAILEMFRQVGPVQYGADGMLKKGVVVRHLILPGQVDNSLGVLEWVAEHFQPGEILFSLMSQYVPCGKAKSVPGMDRPITEQEYDGVLSYMQLLGVEDGFTQEFSSASEEYIPEF